MLLKRIVAIVGTICFRYLSFFHIHIYVRTCIAYSWLSRFYKGNIGEFTTNLEGGLRAAQSLRLESTTKTTQGPAPMDAALSSTAPPAPRYRCWCLIKSTPPCLNSLTSFSGLHYPKFPIIRPEQHTKTNAHNHRGPVDFHRKQEITDGLGSDLRKRDCKAKF